MQSSGYRRWHDVAYWGLLLVACAVFYWMNVLTTFKEDDMLHSLVSGDLTHINTLGDLLHSYWNKYFILNGRTSDMIAEVFCAFWGKSAFNVFNTLVFAALAHVVSLLATGRRSLLALALFIACIGTCYPVPGETMLWLAGSCNYMWPLTASLWLVYYLLHHQSHNVGWLKGLLLLLAAFVTGAGNEATTFAFLAAFILYYLFNRRHLDRQALFVLAGYTLGVLLIVGSPAAWRRVTAEVVTDLSFTDMVFHRFRMTAPRMVYEVTPVVSLVLTAIMLFWKGLKPMKSNLWPFLLLCSALLMFGFGLQMERPFATLALVGLVITINLADYLLKRSTSLRAAAIVLCLLLSGWTSAQAIGVMRQYKVYSDQVRSEVVASPRQAVLHPRRFDASSRFVYPARFSSTDFFNNHYIWRHYFDKENVQFVPDSVYNRFHSGRLLDGAISMPFKGDHGGLVNEVLAFPDQEYMLVSLGLDTVPNAFQVGRSFYRSEAVLSPQERAALVKDGDSTLCRHDLGSELFHRRTTDPLRYQNKVLYVLPTMGDNDSCVLVLLDLFGSDELRLFRTAPNPPDVFKPQP